MNSAEQNQRKNSKVVKIEQNITMDILAMSKK